MENQNQSRANYGLNSVALICEFTSSVWTARKLAKKETDEVVTHANAGAKGAARVTKNLLAGRPELEEIASLVSEARNYVYSNTMPWSDSGQRLLPTTRFIKLDQRMGKYKEQFDAKVTAFVQLYPTLITAQAMALGDMFNRSEYPLASEIAHKFAMNCDYIPVPVAGDLRVDVGNEAQDDLRAKLEAMAEARVSRAVSDITERFTEHLKRMSERLVTDVDAVTGEPKPRRFTETLVSGAFDLCDLIADCNLTGDKKLAEARIALEKTLAGATTTSLREDPAKREDVRAAVSGILDKFSF